MSPDTRSRGLRLPRSARRAQLLEAAQEVFVELGLPRRRHGRDRRPRRRLQTGALPALPRQARPLPRAAGPALRRARRRLVRAALASTHDNKQRVGRHDRGVLRVRRPRRGAVPAGVRVRPDQRGRGPRARGPVSPGLRRGDRRGDQRGHRPARRPRPTCSGWRCPAWRRSAPGYWLDQGSSIPRDEAARLVAALSWRGLGGFPKAERDGAAPTGGAAPAPSEVAGADPDAAAGEGSDPAAG